MSNAHKNKYKGTRAGFNYVIVIEIVIDYAKMV